MTMSNRWRSRLAAAGGPWTKAKGRAAITAALLAFCGTGEVLAADTNGANAAASGTDQVAAASTATTADGSSATQVASTGGNVEATQVEQVTVTARRREEKAQDVPIPITTLNGDALDKDGTFRLEDLSQKLPSANFQFSNPRQTSLAVRGLGNNPANDALESSVGVYLDNVYLGRPGMANTDLVDIDQIGLFRGPQGTLFGKNTTAGVLNITTKLPSFTPEGTAEVSGGDVGYFQARGSYSGPLVGDVLAGRISFVDSYQGGFINDTVSGGKYNGYDRKGLRGQLLYQPNQDLSVRIIGDFNHEASSCCVAVPYSFGPTVTLPNGQKGQLWPYQAAQAGAVVPTIDPDYRTATINDKQYMQVNQGGASAEVNWTLPNAFKLTSITAYRSWGFLPVNDGDNLSISAVNDAGQGVDDKQFSQELRLASPSGRNVEYVVGAYYFFQHQNNVQFTQYGPSAGALYGVAALDDVNSQIRSNPTTISAAPFAQATWHITSDLNLTGGIRETYEAKSLQVIRDEATLNGAADAKVLAAYQSGPLSLKNYDLSGLISLDYKLTREVLGYVSLSHGAKAGGINATVPTDGVSSLFIAPEKANDAELGLKSTLLNGRLLLNADAYWTLVKDYQATQLAQTSPGVYSQILSNVGYVRTQGLEGEIQAVPVRGLTLGLTASYNDAIYRSYDNAPCAAEQAVQGATVCNLSGSQVTGAPRWIVNPSVTYNHHLFDDVRGYAIGSYAWRSSFFGAPDDSEYSRIAAYGIANFRAGLTKALFGTDLDLSVFANNAFNKHYVVGGLGQGSDYAYYEYAGAPRIFGATLRAEF